MENIFLVSKRVRKTRVEVWENEKLKWEHEPKQTFAAISLHIRKTLFKKKLILVPSLHKYLTHHEICTIVHTYPKDLPMDYPQLAIQ